MIEVYYQIRDFQPKKFCKKDGEFKLIENTVDNSYYSYQIDSSYKVSEKSIKITFEAVIDMILSQNIEFYDDEIKIAEEDSQTFHTLNKEDKQQFTLNQNRAGKFVFHLQIEKPSAKLKYQRFINQQQTEQQKVLKLQEHKNQMQDEKQSCFLFVTAKPENENTHLQTDKEFKKILNNMNKNAYIMISTRFQQIKRNLQNHKVEIIHFGTHIKSNEQKGDVILLENEEYQQEEIQLQQLGQLFQSKIHKPKIVFLNCCHSELILKKIEKINNESNWILIDKDYGINDNISIKFASCFYNVLLSRQRQLDDLNLKEVFEKVQLDLCVQYINSPQVFNVNNQFSEECKNCNCLQQSIQFILKKEYPQVEKQEKMKELLKFASKFIFFHNKKNNECNFHMLKQDTPPEKTQQKLFKRENQNFLFLSSDFFKERSNQKMKNKRLTQMLNSSPLVMIESDPLLIDDKKITLKMHDLIHKISLFYIQKYCPYYRYILYQPQKKQQLNIMFNDGYPHIQNGFVSLNMISDFIQNDPAQNFQYLKSEIQENLQKNNEQFCILDVDHTKKIKQKIFMSLRNIFENQYQNELSVEYFPTQKIKSDNDEYITTYIKSQIIREQPSQKLIDKKKFFFVFTFKKYSDIKEISKQKENNTNLNQQLKELQFPVEFRFIIIKLDFLQYNPILLPSLQSKIQELEKKKQQVQIIDIEHAFNVKQTIFKCLKNIYENQNQSSVKFYPTKKIKQNQENSDDLIQEYIQNQIAQEEIEATANNINKKRIFKVSILNKSNQQKGNTNLKKLIEEINPGFQIIIVLVNINSQESQNSEGTSMIHFRDFQEILDKNLSNEETNNELLKKLSKKNKNKFEEQALVLLNQSQHKKLKKIDLNCKKVSKYLIKFLASKNLIQLSQEDNFSQKINMEQKDIQKQYYGYQLLIHFLNYNQLNFQFKELSKSNILILYEIIKNYEYLKNINLAVMEQIILLYLSNILLLKYKLCKTLKYQKIIDCIKKYQKQDDLKIKYLDEIIEFIDAGRVLKASEANPNIFNYSFIKQILLKKTKQKNSQKQDPDINQQVLKQMIKNFKEKAAYNYASSKDEYMKIFSKKFLKSQLLKKIKSYEYTQNQISNYFVLFVILERLKLRFKIILQRDNQEKIPIKTEKFTPQITELIDSTRESYKKLIQQDKLKIELNYLIESIKKLKFFIEINYDDAIQAMKVKEKKNLGIDGMIEIISYHISELEEQDQKATQDQIEKFIEKICLVKYYFLFNNKQMFTSTLCTTKYLDELIVDLKIRCLFQFQVIMDTFLNFEGYEQIPKILIVDAFCSQDKFLVQRNKELSFEQIEFKEQMINKMEGKSIQYIKLIFLYSNSKEYFKFLDELKCNIVYLHDLDKVQSQSNLEQIKDMFQRFIKIFFKNLLDKKNKNIFSYIFQKSVEQLNNEVTNKTDSIKFFFNNIDFKNNSCHLHIEINLQECQDYESDYKFLKEINKDEINSLLSQVKEESFLNQEFKKLDCNPKLQPDLKKYLSYIYEKHYHQQIAAPDAYTDAQNFNLQLDTTNSLQITQTQSQEENFIQDQNEIRKTQSNQNSQPVQGPNRASKMISCVIFVSRISKKSNYQNPLENKTNIQIKPRSQIHKDNEQISKHKTERKLQNSNKNKENQVQKQNQQDSHYQDSPDQKQSQKEDNQSYEQTSPEIYNPQSELKVYEIGDIDD
ncbi:hypothetical protein ABPG72_016497 [Tetrahymena utriculariae]